MRYTIAFVVLIGLIGATAAQAIFTGEGYGTSQLAFLNEPNTPTFEPSVEKYWNTYIAQAPNASLTMKTPADTMNIWMNNFPLQFSTPVQIKGTSFYANASKISGLSPAELNSMLLQRDINMDFYVRKNWQYTPTGTVLQSAATEDHIPSKDAKGQILSQSIMGGFTT
jgi:hypothetical protein